MTKQDKKPIVTVVDAVMGTGKSVWASLEIIERGERTVVVLPGKDEIRRYASSFEGVHGVTALVDTEDSRPLKKQFREALTCSNIILTTRQLYEDHLTPGTFDLIHYGKWNLLIDEVPTVFRQVRKEDISATDIRGFLHMGIITKDPLNDRIYKYEVNHDELEGYLKAPPEVATKRQKAVIRDASVKDLIGVEVKTDGSACEMPYYTFSLCASRLNAFQKVTIMTYPFKGSDLDHWLTINDFKVEHLELSRVDKTYSLNDFTLKPHTGKYSGRQFKDLIEILGQTNGYGNKAYGHFKRDFSSTQMKGFAKLSTEEAGRSEAIVSTRNSLRTHFVNHRDAKRKVDPELIMFSSAKRVKHLWVDKNRKLYAKHFGEDNWVAFNKIGTNDLSHKTELSYLYNVFQFPVIRHTVNAFGLEYDEDQYALYTLIQWVWRSAIRNGEKIRLFLPSKRMQAIFNRWLNAE